MIPHLQFGELVFFEGLSGGAALTLLVSLVSSVGGLPQQQ
jgi:hypothetical protein